MAGQHPFRFGVYADATVDVWLEHVRQAEALGYATLSVREHLGTDLAPISAMASAAMLTSTIRIGSLIFANDFRNPVMLAREVATLDALSDGRFEFGIGSGYFHADYDATGICFAPARERLNRLFEAVHLIKRAFTEETVDFEGEYYSVYGLSLTPTPVQRPWPPLLLGGGGRRVLEFAATEADIVGINIRSTPQGGFDWSSISPEATSQKVGWVRAAAGERFTDLELHWLVPFFAVTDDPEVAARQFIDAFGAAGEITAEGLLDSPHALIGSEDAVIEMIQRRREEYGVSYVTVFAWSIETFAPIVARLVGK